VIWDSARLGMTLDLKKKRVKSKEKERMLKIRRKSKTIHVNKQYCDCDFA